MDVKAQARKEFADGVQRERDKLDAADPPRRMSLSQVVERLTGPRQTAASSVTIKLSAQGVLMPEITVVAGEPDEVVTTMIESAVGAFRRIVEECAPERQES